MAVYDFLSDLVGAGLLAAAPGLGIAVPDGAVTRGGRLAALARGHGQGEAFGTVLDAIARDMGGTHTRAVPFSQFEQHAQGLVSLIERYRPSPLSLRIALAAARAGRPSAGETNSEAIALDILRRAGADGAFADGRLAEDISFILLDRLFAHLLDDPGFIKGLAAPIEAVAKGDAAPPPRTETPAAPPPAAALPPGAELAASLPPSPTLKLIEERGELAALARLKAACDVSDKALARLLETAGRRGVKPGRLLAEVAEMARLAKDVREQLARPTNEPAELRRLKGEAAALLAAGEYERALNLLKQARRLARDSRRRAEERLDEEMASLKTQMAEEGAAIARLAELALADLDFDAAAELFAEAADTLPQGDRDGAFRLQLRQAETLFRKGEALDAADAFAEAASAYESALRLVSRESAPKAWAAATTAHADALLRRGERETGSERVKAAITAYRAALAAIERTSEPGQHAAASLHLGQALAVLGEREASLETFRAAADAFRDALAGLPRETARDGWSAARLGLGVALLNLDERETSTPAIEEAAQSFRLALAELSPAGSRDGWIAATTNLGNALLALGERHGRTDRIEEALSTFRAALRHIDPAAAPRQYALARLNVANALAALGEREEGTARLEEAAAEFREALALTDKSADALRWAIIQMNLGTVLIRVGQRRDQRRHWLAAAAAMMPALETFEGLGAEDYAAITRSNLKSLGEAWGRLIGGPARAAE